eukprot:3498826-Rhodomonas_salina.1
MPMLQGDSARINQVIIPHIPHIPHAPPPRWRTHTLSAELPTLIDRLDRLHGRSGRSDAFAGCGQILTNLLSNAIKCTDSGT